VRIAPAQYSCDFRVGNVEVQASASIADVLLLGASAIAHQLRIRDSACNADSTKLATSWAAAWAIAEPQLHVKATRGQMQSV